MAGSDLSNPENGGGLLDLEAAEVDWDSSDSHFESDVTEHQSFHQFVRLPIELRHRIWGFFCPDLVAKARVYSFHLSWDGGWEYCAHQSAHLEEQTAAARLVLSIHHESRAMALKVLPDTLPLGQRGELILRLNLETDITHVQLHYSMRRFESRQRHSLSGFYDKVKHLAIDRLEMLLLFPKITCSEIAKSFPQLQTLYLVTEHRLHSGKVRHNIRWCTSNSVNRYYFQVSEIEPGLGEDFRAIFCWPDLVKNRGFAESEEVRPLKRDVDSILEREIMRFQEVLPAEAVRLPFALSNSHGSNVEMWPLVMFSFDKGVARFDKLHSWNGNDEDWSSGSGSSDDDDDDDGDRDNFSTGSSDEYESDGIDDADIDEDASSEEEDDLAVQPLSERSDSPAESGNPESPRGDFGTVMEVGDTMGRFSSISEAESGAGDGDEHQAAEIVSDGDYVARSRRPARRRIVSSESVNGSDAEEAQERLRNRRTNVIISEGDDDEDEDDDGDGDEPTAKRPTHPVDLTGDDSDVEEATSDDDGAEVVGRPMSLAERLRLHREQNPISSEEPDTGAESEDIGVDHNEEEEDQSLEGEEGHSELGSNVDEAFDAGREGWGNEAEEDD